MNNRKPIWPWVVLALLILSLAISCISATKPTNTIFGVQPPVDVQNNQTGEGTVSAPQSDGIPDPVWVAWKAEVETKLNLASGGLFTGWMKGASELLGLFGLGLAAWNKYKGDKDHAKSVAAQEALKDEIDVTDKNVAKVAVAAKVPEHELE